MVTLNDARRVIAAAEKKAQQGVDLWPKRFWN